MQKLRLTQERLPYLDTLSNLGTDCANRFTPDLACGLNWLPSGCRSRTIANYYARDVVDPLIGFLNGYFPLSGQPEGLSAATCSIHSQQRQVAFC